MNNHILGAAVLGRYVSSGLGASHSSAQLAMHNAMANSIGSGLGQYTNTQPTPSKPPLRTPEEIQAQLEARYAEMEREYRAKRFEREMPCSSCKWFKEIGYADHCTQPLVMGFYGPRGLWDVALCGPEKALWEVKLSRWDRFADWLLSLFSHGKTTA